MFKKLIIIFIVGLFTLSACAPASSGEPRPSEELISIRLPMGFIPNIQYAPVYVAADKGYYAEAGFDVQFDYAFETDGVALVAANELPFALVSGEQVLLARAQGLPVVYVMAWYQEFPISVIAKTGQGIESIEQLAGKNVGLPGLFGANYIGLRALLFHAGVEETDLTLESIGFNQVEALATGRSQAVVGYIANEPIQLRAQGYELVEFKVADYLQLASNGVITNESVIANDPDMVRRFVQATLKGIADTIANPEEAYLISQKYVENLEAADKNVQMQVLMTSIDMWKAERLGYANPAAWENMHRVLVDMGLIPETLDVTSAFSNEFIE